MKDNRSGMAEVLGLGAYAGENRYRLRNLHDGHPVPPAIRRGPSDRGRGYWGKDDRRDAIVGHDGYMAMEDGNLEILLFYGSSKGVNLALARLEAIGGRVAQIGDTEVGATVPVSQIDEILKLIRVSKLRPGNPRPFRPGTERVLVPESPQ